MIDNQEGKITIDFFLILKHFLVVTALVAIISLITNVSASILFYVVLLIAIYYTGWLLFTRLPLSILINPQEGMLTITFFRLFKKWQESYDYRGLVCTYQKEVGAKGGRLMTFKLTDQKGKSLLKINPDLSGWSDKKLSMIYKALTGSIEYPSSKSRCTVY